MTEGNGGGDTDMLECFFESGSVVGFNEMPSRATGSSCLECRQMIQSMP